MNRVQSWYRQVAFSALSSTATSDRPIDCHRGERSLFGYSETCSVHKNIVTASEEPVETRTRSSLFHHLPVDFFQRESSETGGGTMERFALSVILKVVVIRKIITTRSFQCNNRHEPCRSRFIRTTWSKDCLSRTLTTPVRYIERA